MKIRFLKPATPVGFGYRENETADLPAQTAQMLIKKGYAVQLEAVEEIPETRESKALPETRGRKKGK